MILLLIYFSDMLPTDSDSSKYFLRLPTASEPASLPDFSNRVHIHQQFWDIICTRYKIQEDNIILYQSTNTTIWTYNNTKKTQYNNRVILILKISELPIVHVPTLFPLPHRFQNTFCFLCSSTPSIGGGFFWKSQSQF